MEKNIRYGYCRCSTNEINQDITRQINELKKVGVVEKNIVYAKNLATYLNKLK